MYNNNFIDGFVTKEKFGNNFVRIIKIVNFFVHLIIISILLFSFLKYFEIINYNNKIIEVRTNIDRQRSENDILEKEKEWEKLYYEILAIKEMLKNCTNYSYVLKDIGIYIPSKDFIIALSLVGNEVKMDWFINKEKLKNLISFYDYASILNSAFEKSEYIKNSFLIETMEKKNIYNQEINSLKIKVEIK